MKEWKNARLKTMEKNKTVIHKKDIDKSCCQHDKTYWHRDHKAVPAANKMLYNTND